MSEVDTSSNPAAPRFRGLAHELTAQATSGTGPRSLCQAYTAARAAATIAMLPHVAVATTSVFGAIGGTASRT